MKIVKIIWGVIAIIWLWSLNSSLSSNVGYVESAMQASQLYNEATVTILGIIAFTLLLNFGDEPNNKSAEQIEKQTKELVEQSKRIVDVLNRLEQSIERFTNSSTPVPESISMIAQESPVILPKSEPTEIICPKCHVPMIIQTATKGENQGKKFYVCPNYKQCQQFLPVE